MLKTTIIAITVINITNQYYNNTKNNAKDILISILCKTVRSLGF